MDQKNGTPNDKGGKKETVAPKTEAPENNPGIEWDATKKEITSVSLEEFEGIKKSNQEA